MMAHPTSYQRVTTANDYDLSASAYLEFDGVDDFLSTGDIDFTGTDKVTVVAGVRKLGVDRANVLSHYLNSNRFIYLEAPRSSTARYAMAARANTSAVSPASSSTNPDDDSPATNVLAGSADISGEQVELRVDGSPKEPYTGTLGTDTTFKSAPLYVGSQTSSTRLFNGHLYGLIVRGAKSTLREIESAEAWVNERTGAYE